MSDRDTRRELLDLAETLVRTRGYNGFSYRDLAEQIGIKTASIHYHFPTKGDLGEALIENEREVFARNLAQLDAAEKDPRRRLKRFIQLFQSTTIGCHNRMCLGAMLAVEQETLPDAVGQASGGSSRITRTGLRSCWTKGERSGNSGSRGPRIWPPGPCSRRSKGHC